MQDTNDNRVAHLNIIQDVIKRLAGNSFLVKGWSLTLVSALMALAITSKRIEIGYLVVVPALIFWGLDAYWLRQERLFRALYNNVRTAPVDALEAEIFSMDTTPFADKVSKLGPTMLNPTIWLLHGCIVAAAVAAIIIFNY